MKLIVGLGNPGKEYDNTKHNVGFLIIDNYLKIKELPKMGKKFNGLYLKTNINDKEVILLKPLLYMNLSGGVVKKYVDYFKINVDDILIISDDLDQELSKYKLKCHGGSGGHNGLKDIEDNLGTDNYKRLKVGISNDKTIDGKDYVLSKFNKKDKQILKEVISKSINIIDDFVINDFESLMNKYN